MTTIQVKVQRNSGDFERALHSGFAINLYNCTDKEMWLVMPKSVSEDTMNKYVEQEGFIQIKEVA